MGVATNPKSISSAFVAKSTIPKSVNGANGAESAIPKNVKGEMHGKRASTKSRSRTITSEVYIRKNVNGALAHKERTSTYVNGIFEVRAFCSYSILGFIRIPIATFICLDGTIQFHLPFLLIMKVH